MPGGFGCTHLSRVERGITRYMDHRWLGLGKGQKRKEDQGPHLGCHHFAAETPEGWSKISKLRMQKGRIDHLISEHLSCLPTRALGLSTTRLYLAMRQRLTSHVVSISTKQRASRLLQRITSRSMLSAHLLLDSGLECSLGAISRDL